MVIIKRVQDRVLAPDIEFGNRIKYYSPQFLLDNISSKVGGCHSQICRWYTWQVVRVLTLCALWVTFSLGLVPGPRVLVG